MHVLLYFSVIAYFSMVVVPRVRIKILLLIIHFKEEAAGDSYFIFF